MYWGFRNNCISLSTEIMQSINMLQKAGVWSNKILLGIGFYGRNFKLADPNCYQPGCPIMHPGTLDEEADNY